MQGEQARVDRDVDDRAGRVRGRARLLAPPGAWGGEHGNRRVIRYEHDGSVTVIADSWNGKRLNAPNDIVVHPDGGIWFTDPGYGAMMNYEGNKGPLEIKEAVYRVDPQTGKMALVSDELGKPNGICFSPDYKKLYVVHGNIFVWDVVDNVRLKNKQTFCTMALGDKKGGADGIRCDVDGNIWAAAGWAGDGFEIGRAHV